MSDGDWRELLAAFVDRRINEAIFHDRFFDAWNRLSAAHFAIAPPPAIEELFYVVEAYCPDPALRDPESPYEADDAELRAAAERALARLSGREPG